VIEEAAKEGIALGLRAERRWVRRLLRRHWPDLERIAAELLEDEGVRLFDGHGRRLILRDTARVGAWLVDEVSS